MLQKTFLSFLLIPISLLIIAILTIIIGILKKSRKDINKLTLFIILVFFALTALFLIYLLMFAIFFGYNS
jgi:L-cystine uptake protein TcyP (sodium:dicarboxylate symporter family)